MPKIKLVIAHCSFLSTRWHNYYCIPSLIDEFDLEYWDCSSLIPTGFSGESEYNYAFVSKILSWKELEGKVKDLPWDALIVYDVNSYAPRFLKTLANNERQLIYINFFSNSIEYLPDNKASDVERNGFFYSAFRKMYHLFVGIYYRIENLFHISVKYPTILSISCEKDSAFRINHPDYEVYHQLISSDCENNADRYYVYIDNNYPFHNDITVREGKELDTTSISKEFRKSMCSFFDRIEEYYKCKVIIAIHPTSSYPKDYFGNRLMVSGITGKLVKGCAGVFMHTSNAISFAFLFQKPVVLLTNGAYYKTSSEYYRLKKMASETGFPIFDTDNDCVVDLWRNQPNNAERKRYISEYLTDIKLPVSNTVLIPRYLKQIHYILYSC